MLELKDYYNQPVLVNPIMIQYVAKENKETCYIQLKSASVRVKENFEELKTLIHSNKMIELKDSYNFSLLVNAEKIQYVTREGEIACFIQLESGSVVVKANIEELKILIRENTK